MAKAATLRTLSDDQLLDELDSAKQELFNLRFAFATGQLDNSAQMAATKRDIARIHTVLREREIAAAEPLCWLALRRAQPLCWLALRRAQPLCWLALRRAQPRKAQLRQETPHEYRYL